MSNWLELLIGILSALVTGLISVGVYLLKKYIDAKLGDSKTATLATELTDIVSNAVLYFWQTTVDTAKKDGTWNSQTAEDVKAQCIAYIEGKLTDDLKAYVKEHNQDIGDLIESAIAGLLK